MMFPALHITDSCYSNLWFHIVQIEPVWIFTLGLFQLGRRWRHQYCSMYLSPISTRFICLFLFGPQVFFIFFISFYIFLFTYLFRVCYMNIDLSFYSFFLFFIGIGDSLLFIYLLFVLTYLGRFINFSSIWEESCILTPLCCWPISSVLLIRDAMPSQHISFSLASHCGIVDGFNL